jgi:sugar phosphate isomerase/epimerase
LDVDAALELLIPHAAHLHVKDVASARPLRFALPGAAGYDYAGYFRTLGRLGYGGAVTVEVSGHVWKDPAYRPWEAARASFAVLDSGRALSTE